MSKFNFDKFNKNREEIRKDANTFEPLPPGKYKCRVRDAEIRENSKDTGQILSVQFEVAEGEHARRTVFEHLNIIHENPQAELIGLGRLDQLCRAAGVSKFTSEDDLLDCEVTVVVRLQKDDEDRNEVVRYVVPKRNKTEKKSRPAPVDTPSTPAPDDKTDIMPKPANCLF